jgi:hypothetical protein
LEVIDEAKISFVEVKLIGTAKGILSFKDDSIIALRYIQFRIDIRVAKAADGPIKKQCCPYEL